MVLGGTIYSAMDGPGGPILGGTTYSMTGLVAFGSQYSLRSDLGAPTLTVVYNHWTGLVDWTGGLTFFVLKITFVLSYETSLSCRFRHDAF